MVIIYALTLFISAFLLFWVQLWVGKLLLPLLGGAPGVWNTCMVFFQALLLLGYSYAHILSTRISARYQAIVHTLFLLIPISLLPLSLSPAISPPRDTNPIFWLLGVLVITVGLPSLAIATTAPLIQRWFALAQKNNDPYFLYAASNIGSLLSLVSYPIIIETNFSLSQQSYLWAGGYGILASLTGICAINLWKSAAPEQLSTIANSPILDHENLLDRPSKSQQFRWIILSFLPASLLLGTTTYITTDIAAVPLFWAIPLIVYLLTFILAFTNNSLISQQFNYQKFIPLLPVILTALVISFLLQLMRPIALLVPLHLLGLFFVGYICHGELASDRPKPNYLTLFYFWISVGGVAGGIFNAIISPLLFTSVLEYPSVLIISFLLLPKLASASNSGIISELTPELISKLTADLTSNLNSDLNSEKSISKSISELTPKSTSQTNNSRFRFSVPISLGLILATLIVGFSPRFVWSDWLGIILVIMLWLGIYKTFNLSKIRLLVGLLLLSLLGQFSLTTMGQVLVSDRSFFGIYRVVSQQQGQYYSLFHGTTLHGKQSQDPKRRDEPLTYFSATGPIGQVFNYFSRKDTLQSSAQSLEKLKDNTAQNSHIAVLGLGVGTLFSYARSPQEWKFYEIDPVVVKLATDPQYFSFLTDNPSNSKEAIKRQIILGDGRLQLAKAQDDYYDLLVMDAFSSDAIPTHLVTLEAMQLYLQKLRTNGIIAVNISNRFINLEPVLAKLAQELNLVSYSQVDRAITAPEKEQGKTASHWVIMARNQESLGSLITDFPWQNLSTKSTSKSKVWTDDFSDIWQVLKLNERENL